MKRYLIAVAIFLSALCGGYAWAAGYSYRLQISTCSPAAPPDGEDGQPDSRWVPYKAFVQSCPVFDANHHLVLTVLTVRTDLMERAKLPDDIPDNVQQQILDAKGNYLGSVIGTFPLSDPSSVKLTFADWRHNFPWKIIANFSDHVGLDGPGGNDTVYLWDPKADYYAGPAGQ